MYLCLNICICMYICTHIRVYIYIYIYMVLVDSHDVVQCSLSVICLCKSNVLLAPYGTIVSCRTRITHSQMLKRSRAIQTRILRLEIIALVCDWSSQRDFFCCLPRIGSATLPPLMYVSGSIHPIMH